MSLKSWIARCGIAAVTAMLAMGLPTWAVTVPAGGSLIDDCESGTNQNLFYSYWYFYDDNKDGGNSQIPNATKDGTGAYVVAPIAGQGNAGSAGFRLDYKMGTVGAPCGTGCSYNFAGMGTMLALDGTTLNITGATKITYWAKSDVPVKLNVEVATSGVTDFGYHRKLQPITATWTQYEIVLVEGIGIAQPTWAKPVPLDLTKATKVQWQVHTDQTPPTQGSIFIDDVVIESYDFAAHYVPADACASCVTTTGSHTGALFTNMEDKPTNQNAAGGYWYCYNDAAGRTVTSQTQFSDITSGAVKDATDLTAPPLLTIAANGASGSNGAVIEYELGPSFPQGTANVKGFVGIGTGLSDKNETMFYNATVDGATGVYFEYQCTGVPYMKFEVPTMQLFGTNAGILFYIMLPATLPGEWKAAKVPFSSLVLPDWAEVKLLAPSQKVIDITKIRKFQWSVQDKQGTTGKIAVDNVYLIGASKVTPYGVAVRSPLVRTRMSGVRTLVTGNTITVDYSALGTDARSVSLMNSRGEVITSAAVSTSETRVVSMHTQNRTPGFYIVRVSLKNGSEMSVPVTLY